MELDGEVGVGGGLSGVLLVNILYFTNGPAGGRVPAKTADLRVVHFRFGAFLFLLGFRSRWEKITCRSESRVLDKRRRENYLVIISTLLITSPTSLVIGSIQLFEWFHH